MRPNARLYLSAALIVLSATYAVMVAQNPQVASAVSSGYVAILLSVIVAVNAWKKP